MRACSKRIVSRLPDSGFTLLEMLVVIAVMAGVLVLLTVSGPPRGHQLQAEAAARNVAGAMWVARGQAIVMGHKVALVVPAVPGWLAVSMAAPPGGIVFYPDGSSSGGDVWLTADGHVTDISTLWLTGRVRIDAR